jgi:NitT/TauT family transport system substrate-binding protein
MQATESNVGQLSTTTLAQGSQNGEEFVFFCGGLNYIRTSLVSSPDSDLPAVDDGASWDEVLKSLEGRKLGIQTPVGSGGAAAVRSSARGGGRRGRHLRQHQHRHAGGHGVARQRQHRRRAGDAAGRAEPRRIRQGQAAALPARGSERLQEQLRQRVDRTRAWLEEDPDAADAYCDSVKEGLAFIQDDANAEEAAALLQEDTGVPADVAEKVIADDIYADFSTEMDPAVIDETLQMYVDLDILQPQPQPKPSSDELVQQMGS